MEQLDFTAQETFISYANPQDGKTYYSGDEGKTFEALTDKEWQEQTTLPDTQWWTYGEYAAWLEQEKLELESIIGERGWTSGRGAFIWTQELVDEAIAMYEGVLQDIKNGAKLAKGSTEGADFMISDGPDTQTAQKEKGYQIYLKLDNGDEAMFGPYETVEELLENVKPFCEEQVRQGNMTQAELDEIMHQYVQE